MDRNVDISDNNIEIPENGFSSLEEWFYFNIENIYDHKRGYDYYEMHNTLQTMFELYYIHRKQKILNNYLYDNPSDLSSALEEYIRAYLLFVDIDKDIIKKKTEQNISIIKESLERINNVPKQKQRSPEWYEFRKRNFTASDFYKIFSDNQLNSVIKKKLHPNISNGFHPSRLPLAIKRGVMYEDVAIAIYENMFNTNVSEHGCIPHMSIEGLAASPDGIIEDISSSKYGHMIEIKCVLSRELNGEIPEVYWVQMQVQMEVCNLEFCDFFECDFKEISTEEELLYYVNDNNIKYYGIFYEGVSKNSGEPKYIYSKVCDLNINNVPDDYVHSETHYWYLESFTLRTIRRNRDWFNNIYDRFIHARDLLNEKRDNPELLININKKEKEKEKKNKSKMKQTAIFEEIYDENPRPNTIVINTNENLKLTNIKKKKVKKTSKNIKKKVGLNKIFMSGKCLID
jgi:putative phage-type endonuclease